MLSLPLVVKSGVWGAPQGLRGLWTPGLKGLLIEDLAPRSWGAFSKTCYCPKAQGPGLLLKSPDGSFSSPRGKLVQIEAPACVAWVSWAGRGRGCWATSWGQGQMPTFGPLQRGLGWGTTWWGWGTQG